MKLVTFVGFLLFWIPIAHLATVDVEEHTIIKCQLKENSKDPLGVVHVLSWSDSKSLYLTSCRLFRENLHNMQQNEYHIHLFGFPVAAKSYGGLLAWLEHEPWREEIERYKGRKLIVLSAEHVPMSLVRDWPRDSTLLITNDENNRFGFAVPIPKDTGNGFQRHLRYSGPKFKKHQRPTGEEWTTEGVNLGNHLNGLLNFRIRNRRHMLDSSSNFTSTPLCSYWEDEVCSEMRRKVQRIKLPPTFSTPVLKQYYSQRHELTFRTTFQFFPLGPRFDFHMPSFTPSAEHPRKWLFNFLGSSTSLAREILMDTLKALPDSIVRRGMTNLADHWASDNSKGNRQPEEYTMILCNSTFTLCPRGHNMEQYRIYEAMECGSIPVLALENGLLNQTISPALLNSPMVFVPEWDRETFTTLAMMESDSVAIQERRLQISAFYKHFLRQTLANLDAVLT
eukprot:m.119843 g.119843  ORF g.119843 m.119843 type:complete len:451 (-) comp14336_c0_seq2:446-1798(-)